MHHLQLAAGIVYRGWAHVERHNILGVEAQVDTLEILQGAREQARAHQQQAREPTCIATKTLRSRTCPCPPVVAPASSFNVRPGETREP